jgi:hypothetical protein
MFFPPFSIKVSLMLEVCLDFLCTWVVPWVVPLLKKKKKNYELDGNREYFTQAKFGKELFYG